MTRQVSSDIHESCAQLRSGVLGNCLPEGGKDSVLMGKTLWGIEREPRAQPNVALVLHNGHAVEALQDHVIVDVVPGVPDGHIL